MLEVRELEVAYGPIRAVRGLGFAVPPGQVVALIGANGAGKSSTVRAIAGLLPRRGSLRFEGKPLPAAPEAVLRAGIALVPEGRGILQRLTVEENLLLGAATRRDRARIGAEIAAQYERFPILGLRRHGLAGLLSGGEQQMLAIARALLARPRLLILDEPSIGLAPKLVEQVFRLVEELRATGLAILLVEQKARQTLRIADHAVLLETGRLRAAGPPAALTADGLLAKAFLGEGGAAG
ncbi:ABC transporter ATP-binding protein [Paracraurococcus lichenis]|uniref:ABC transporter ATP-binding protein n=1 Tax=Paracraurococcus lichenis TaxID=3064888 RepID=A0ABT9E989_9PROT|nr:ABC transporter ATP-binding protein [Paracraurococcus sp. LOR1-02]MDO9712664.1 ABC transporter ATP-binding protein [Paracraurococcus sp. LOR1-02]